MNGSLLESRLIFIMKKIFLTAFCVFILIAAQNVFTQNIPTKIPDHVIVLTFDDAVSNHATLVAPLLKKYGFGATFYVCEFPPDFSTNKEQYMTWQQIKMISDMGFEIGNHTGHHVGIKNISKVKLVSELNFIDSICVEKNIHVPTTFAYPGCGYSLDNLPVLKEHGIIFARTCENHPYDPTKDDPLLIPSFAIQGKDSTVFYDAIKKAVNGNIVVLLFHGIPDKLHPWVDTQPELFEKYMKYLFDNNFAVISMRDLSRFIPHGN
jgi:peptidoglycan-N-acetylglucosamine deacetylase